jgi:hypothetical protein
MVIWEGMPFGMTRPFVSFVRPAGVSTSTGAKTRILVSHNDAAENKARWALLCAPAGGDQEATEIMSPAVSTTSTANLNDEPMPAGVVRNYAGNQQR